MRLFVIMFICQRIKFQTESALVLAFIPDLLHFYTSAASAGTGFQTAAGDENNFYAHETFLFLLRVFSGKEKSGGAPADERFEKMRRCPSSSSRRQGLSQLVVSTCHLPQPGEKNHLIYIVYIARDNRAWEIPRDLLAAPVILKKKNSLVLLVLYQLQAAPPVNIIVLLFQGILKNSKSNKYHLLSFQVMSILFLTHIWLTCNKNFNSLDKKKMVRKTANYHCLVLSAFIGA